MPPLSIWSVLIVYVLRDPSVRPWGSRFKPFDTHVSLHGLTGSILIGVFSIVLGCPKAFLTTVVVVVIVVL